VPFPNEHAARIRAPGSFVRIRQLWSRPNRGIRALGGPLKSSPTGGSKIQSIRFKRTKWTPATAKAWLKRHGYKWIMFENASG